ncbi:MBG domain-containing protein [Mucilaginibacter jinjuensis]|uniref:MBG domain-containing protein n=1 Tax=Mucilaginibacter jinjuensis TaxID=1176721 RepID=A0ABY7TDE9_9SPHI|nr:MBG domain-containing protein [Mucilaginibacter jinjuensis]WCT13192.1 MBG domain-containing protein [Mucilaginibacter jinjuensis]
MVKTFTRPNFCIVFFIAVAMMSVYSAHANIFSTRNTFGLSIENPYLATPTISFSNTLAGKPYGSADFVPATSNSSAPITFNSSDASVATIVNGRVHIIGLGSSTITVTQGANSQFSAITTTATLTVVQASPAITFISNLSPQAYTTTDFLPATATLGASIIYTTDNANVATIINNKVHLISTGTVNITASIAPSPQYAATSVSTALVVQKSTPAIAFITGLNAKAFTTTDFAPATITPAVPVIFTSDNPAVATIINNNVHLVSAGTANITATITGTDLYNGTSRTTALTVVPSTPVITFLDLSAKPYTSTDIIPATVSPAVPVVYNSDNPAVATIINNRVHLVAIGSATITATTTGTDLYTGANQTVVLNVIKATPAITFISGLNVKPFTTTDFAPATITPAVPVIYTSDNPAVATIINNNVHIVGIGVANITAVVTGTDLYNGATQTTALNVVQATPIISFIPGLNSKAFSTTDFNPATSNPVVPITFTSSNLDVATIINNNVHLVGAGTTTITATITGNALYTGATSTSALTVTTATPIISFIAGLNTKPFTSVDFAPASSNPAVPIIYTSDNPAVATIINNNVHLVGLGTANITATIAGTSLYNSVTQTTAMNVVQATPVISFIAGLNAKPFTTVDFVPATTSPVIPIIFTSDNPAVATIINNNVHLVGLGTTNITANIAGTSLYSGIVQSTALNVVQATPIISFITGLNAKPFTTTDFAPATTSPAVPVIYTSDNPTVATIINNNVHLIGLGTANITTTIAGTSLYSGVVQSTALNVVQATPVISFIAGLNAKPFTTSDFTAASATPALPIIFTSSNPAVATIINNNVHLVGTGTTNIAATIAGSALYGGATATTALNVVTATPIISFIAGLNAKSFTTTDFAPASSSPALPIIYTSDNPAVATIINNNVHLVGLGTANITATIAGTDLYNGVTQTTAINVVQATPIISFIAGLNNKPFTATDFTAATASPAVPIIFTSDNPAVATIINNNVHLVGLGTANITATIAGTSLYSGVVQSTALNVVQAIPIISFIAGLNAKPFTTTDFAPATTSPAVPVIFTSDNPAVATIINNNVHVIGLGTANITATIAGTSLYSGVVQSTALNVVQATPVISFIAGLNAKSFTTADFTPASATPALPIIFTSDNPAVATIINNNVHLVGTGTANITATIAGSTLYTGATSTTALTVTTATPIISFVAGLNAKPFTSADFAPASSNPALPIIYTSDNPAVATIINNNVHLVGLGTANITATITNTSLYNGVTQTTALTVVQSAPIISFIAGLNAKPFTTVDFAPATTSPAVPIIFNSDNPAVATIINNNVHLVSTGTANITATVAGTSAYPGFTATTQLNVIKATPIISFIAGLNAKPFTANDFVAATSNPALPIIFSSDNPAVATIINNNVHLVGLGTANITATMDGSSNTLYNGTSATMPLTVTQATPIISFIAGLNARPFSTTDFVPATANPAIPIIFTSDNPDVATIINNYIHLIGLGTANITATTDASTLYTGINASTPLTVVKANPVISFIAGLNAKQFTSTDFTPASSNPAVPITYTSDNPAVATIVNNLVHLVGVGTANITATIAPGDLYNGTTASTPLVVTQATPIISFIAGLNAKQYSTTNFTPATANPVVPIIFTSDNPAVATIVNNQIHLVGLGTANITATIDGSGSNGLYNSVTATTPLIVIQATPVISFIAGLNAKPYTSVNFTPATSNPSEPITFTSDNPAVATIVNNQVHIVNLGTANITATIDGSTSNGLYNSATAVTPLNVIKATPIISFIAGLNAKAFTITDFAPASSNPALPITYSIDPSQASVATIVNNQVHLVGLGTATITATVDGSSTTLYNSTSSSSALVVTKSAPVITFIPGLSPKAYGTADFAPATAAPAVPITYQSSNLSVATIVSGKVHIVGLGTTTITATISDNSQYSGTTASATLTISQGTPVITFASNLSPRFYGSGNFTPASATLGAPITYTLSNNNVISISSSNAAQIIGVGTVTITATTPSNNLYVGTTASATVTINQATPVISFIAGLNPKPYTSINFTPATATFSAPITFTSDNPAVATIVSNQVHLVGLGTANITATTPNNAFYVGQTLTTAINVIKSSPVITFVSNFSPRDYGTANFTPATATLGAPVTLTSDNPAVATIVSGQVHIVAPGTANITATTPDNTLFNGATLTAQLVINKATPILTFAALPAKTYGDNPSGIVLNATTTNSTIPVTYSSDNTAVATIGGTSNNTLFIVGAGTANIIAAQVGNSFYNPVSVTNSFSVNKVDQTISFAPLNAKTYGDADFNLTANASSGVVTYTSSAPSVATVSGNTVHILGTGTTVITASQAGSNNYNAATPIQQTLTVNKANQTITFNTLADRAYGDAGFDLAATASSGLGVTYTSSNPAVAAVTGNTVTIIGVGSTTITATQNGNDNYNAATALQQTLNVGKATQAITFNTLPGKSYGDADFDLNASASSGLSVEYLSSNPAVASVSGNTVTIIGAGSTIITASQSGNDNYSEATPVQQTLNVGEADQTITFNTLPGKTFGDAGFNLSATASSGLYVNYTSSNLNVATVSGNTVTIVGGGSATITASQGGNDNYNAATNVQQTLNVGKANQTIAFNSLAPKFVGDANFDLTATTSSGLGITYSSSDNSVATVTGNTITVVGAGSATITATQAGNDNYSAATPVQQLLTVNKVSQTITFNTLPNKFLGDASFDLNASATSGLAVSYVSSNTAVATITGNTVTILSSGSASITASQPGDATYGAATPVTRSLTVGKQDQTITFTTLPAKTLGDADFSLTATSTNATIPVTYSSGNTAVAVIIDGNLHIVGAGTATITGSQAGSANYNAAADVVQTLTVNKAAQTITFNTLTDKVFGDADFALLATSSSGLAVSYVSSNTAVATISGNTVHIIGVGTSTITASQSGNASYSAATAVLQTLNVGKASQTISFDALIAKTYGNADFNLSATSSSGLPVSYSSSNTAVATISGNTVHIVRAGTTNIIASQSGNGSYAAATNVQQQLAINTVAIAITAVASSKAYGSVDPQLTYTYTGTLAAGDNFTGALTRAAGENVNTYAINQGTLALNGNYTLTYNGAVFSITKKVLTVTADNQAKTYGTANPAFTIKYSGFVNNETTSNLTSLPTVSTDATVASNAGTYVITPAGGSAANYDFNYVTGTFTINKATLTATAGNSTRVYGTANPDFTVTYSGFVNGDTQTAISTLATASTAATVNTAVGTYTINPVGGAAVNYQFTYAPGTLTITKATRSITFSNPLVKTYGDADFDGGATAPGNDAITYTSDNAAVATVVNGKLHITGAGNANITASLPDNANYFATASVTQPLIVNKANQTIRFNAIPALNRGVTYDLSIVTASSGLPVNFTSSDAKIAAINSQSLTAVSIGVANITASQTGNANYNAATSVMQSANVQDPSGQEIIVHQAMSPNGDGINDVLFIEGISEHPTNHVTLINRNGVKIYEINNYDNLSRAFDGHSNITGALMQAGTYFYLVEYTVNGEGRHKTGYFVLKY